MRFATFNVLHGRTLEDGRPVPVPPAQAGRPLADAVTGLGADVLALQEVDRFQERSGDVDQARVAAEAAGAPEWRYASAVHGQAVPGKGWVLDPSQPALRVHGPHDDPARDDVPSHGIALLSRLPVREWRAMRFAPAPLAIPLRVPGRPGLTLSRDQPRAALAAVIGAEHGELTVVAVHLSFVPGWNIRQLLAVRDRIADLPRPHVLLGDFNLIGPIPRLVLNTAELVAPVAGRARRASGRDGWRDLARVRTYPSHRPMVQFDHVLVSGTPRCAPVASDAPRVPVSDHRPVVVDLPW
ncbi:endonuclease/exonuclease/phosphatase family protein [Streptomyces sp. NPDC057403]|uniref:endonuclease/exonuclease/phosphatase family protein n=1 Tax=Streptomyces sp. NPDC057403 TaxID=3346119 RepID=UPI0036812B57